MRESRDFYHSTTAEKAKTYTCRLAAQANYYPRIVCLLSVDSCSPYRQE